MTGQGRLRLIVGWITLFLIGTDLFVVSPLLPALSQEYEVSSAAAGWMVTVFSVTYAAAAPVFGWLSDRSGRRLLITVGLLLFAVSNIATAYAPAFSWLIASRMLAGLAVASITPLIYASIGDTAPPDRRGAWLSVAVSGHLTALCAGAPLGTWLEHFFGWRSVFLILAMAGAVLTLWNSRAWTQVKTRSLPQSPLQGNVPAMLGSVCVTALWAIAMYALYVYLGAALYYANRFTASDIALAIAFYGIGAVMGSLLSGQLTDKLGARSLSNTALLGLTIILIGLGSFFSAGGWVYIFLFLWALVGYAGFTSYQARLAEAFPKTRGMIMAWNNTALYIGITAGSIIGGYVVSQWGYGPLPYVCSVAAGMSWAIGSLRKLQAQSAGIGQQD